VIKEDKIDILKGSIKANKYKIRSRHGNMSVRIPDSVQTKDLTTLEIVNSTLNQSKEQIKTHIELNERKERNKKIQNNNMRDLIAHSQRMGYIANISHLQDIDKEKATKLTKLPALKRPVVDSSTKTTSVVSYT
jgi:hypothetical protein